MKKDIISSAPEPLPSRIDEVDALALELCAAQMEAIGLRAEAIAAKRAGIERAMESKYSIKAGRDHVDLAARSILRGE